MARVPGSLTLSTRRTLRVKLETLDRERTGILRTGPESSLFCNLDARQRDIVRTSNKKSSLIREGTQRPPLSERQSKTERVGEL